VNVKIMKRAESFFIGIERGIRAASRVFNWIAMISVAIMMTLTVADVILRLFRNPITGTYEIVGLLGAVFVSFSLAYTSVERGHIAVDFLVQRLRLRGQKVIDCINAFICSALFGIIAWQAVVYAGSLRNTGEVSLTIQVPLYPFVFGVAIGCGLLCIVLLFRFVGSLFQACSQSKQDR
jgi:TRAP-type C4-dicarboxylate transport system permease small subunit